MRLMIGKYGIKEVEKLPFLRQKKVLFVKGNEKYANLIEEKLRNQTGWQVTSGTLCFEERERLANALSEAEMVIFGSDTYRNEEMIQKCMEYGKEILVIPRAYDVFINHASMKKVDDIMLLSIRPPRLNPLQNAVKRGMDIILSLLLLIFFLPLMFSLFLLIPITSSGPALYKQERLGLCHRPFQIYKFRTMVVDAEEKSGPMLATENDPRVTALGKLLRSSRLDELPQLFNVLKGEMSLIGPRPERPMFVEQFKRENHSYAYRFMVKPGLTGLAQVKGKYYSSPEAKLRFDLMYIYKYSLLLDFKILLFTAPILFRGIIHSGAKRKDKQIYAVEDTCQSKSWARGQHKSEAPLAFDIYGKIQRITKWNG